MWAKPYPNIILFSRVSLCQVSLTIVYQGWRFWGSNTYWVSLLYLPLFHSKPWTFRKQNVGEVLEGPWPTNSNALSVCFDAVTRAFRWIPNGHDLKSMVNLTAGISSFRVDLGCVVRFACIPDPYLNLDTLVRFTSPHIKVFSVIPTWEPRSK